MKQIIFILIMSILFFGCTKTTVALMKSMPDTYLTKVDFDELPNWESENYEEALGSFINSCQSSKTQKIYKDLCQKANNVQDAKEFLQREFSVYKIEAQDDEEGLLTGYYEPSLKGSLTKKGPFVYPLYKEPNDLISVELTSIYPDLKNYRLRGRIEGKKLVPYYTRADTKEDMIDAEVLCYTDSKIDRFFLEVQGSGRVNLDNNETIFIGFANQNGHRYSSIGKYLIDADEIKREDVSLQRIRAWLQENPQRVDEVLHYNESVVFFQKRSRAASGSLGLVLTPMRSVAIDRNFIPLGSMLFLDAKINNQNVSRVVMAEDTGGAIKGALRADMFFGATQDAMNLAGELISPLKLWIFLPKDSR